MASWDIQNIIYILPADGIYHQQYHTESYSASLKFGWQKPKIAIENGENDGKPWGPVGF